MSRWEGESRDPEILGGWLSYPRQPPLVGLVQKGMQVSMAVHTTRGLRAQQQAIA